MDEIAVFLVVVVVELVDARAVAPPFSGHSTPRLASLTHSLTAVSLVLRHFYLILITPI